MTDLELHPNAKRELAEWRKARRMLLRKRRNMIWAQRWHRFIAWLNKVLP